MSKKDTTTECPERWLPAPGYEGFYEVSDLGRVRGLDRIIRTAAGVRAEHTRTLKGRMLSQVLNGHGYPIVVLSKGAEAKQKLVHRLVATAFIGPCPEGMECCHNNGDRTDSRVENLRWDTRSNNALDAVAHGTHTQTRKTHCPKGHPYTPENIGPSSWPGGRSCKTCRNHKARTAVSA